MRPRATIRLRLTLLYAALLVTCTAVLLGMSWWLLGGHLDRTLPPAYADAVMGRLAGQYVLAVLGAALVALGLGWVIAGHVLKPIRGMVDTARRVSERHLDERIALDGPDDELRELAATLDDMLDRLQEALESQRRFVANASHELRTPLTVIRAQTDVALADPHATVEDLRAMGSIVLETTDRMELLLESLLKLARGSRGELAGEPLDLAGLAGRVVDGARAEAADAEVALRLRAEPVSVAGDSILIERLLANLVENALRHNVPGGFAEVEVIRSASGGATVRVTNGGARIPPEALERLAEPFERVARHHTPRGSGLGLSIVRAVAEAHGGALTLEARPDGGLGVGVDLPAASGHPRAAGDPQAPAALIGN